MAGQAVGAAARLPFRIAGRGVSNIGGAFASGSLSTLFAGIPGLGGLAGMAEGSTDLSGETVSTPHTSNTPATHDTRARGLHLTCGSKIK